MADIVFLDKKLDVAGKSAIACGIVEIGPLAGWYADADLTRPDG